MKPCRIELSEANAFIDVVHRHHDPVQGHRFSVGAEKAGKLVGVATCGRPVAQMSDKKYLLEVTRLATDGTPNACSFLYGLCARIGTLLGFREIQTFTLISEPGKSLLASGWTHRGVTEGGEWSRKGKGRQRKQAKQSGPKNKWSKLLTIDAAKAARANGGTKHE